jgi:8-oxo-dGTP pyrophosphatase MutT (NUDIX family)
MKSYKVYFENRFITVSTEPDRMQKYALFHRFHSTKELYQTISLFQTGDDQALNIYGVDIEHIWNNFQGYFKFVEAAGGLVRHTSGRYLFIVRNGRWDLPKGHMEEGESSEFCALREVEEECGISGHSIVKGLNPSYHTWVYEGVSYLKRTSWFLMEYSGEMIEAPQAEEGITEAHWLLPERVCIIRQSAWDSLTDIINLTILNE